MATPSIGVTCKGYADPEPGGQKSYAVSEIASRGVPPLTHGQASLIHRIRRYIHSNTLRFAFLETGFIVFNAPNWPCSDIPPGDLVLNAVNSFYQPGENAFNTHGMPDPPTPGPWMKP